MRTTTCRHDFSDIESDLCAKCGMSISDAEKESERIHADIKKFEDAVKSGEKCKCGKPLPPLHQCVTCGDMIIPLPKKSHE